MKSNKIIKKNQHTPRGLFITGTDTGVGKTYVTQRILQQLSAQSISCVAMKPVASGATVTQNGLQNSDALILQQAASVKVPYELINPYCFEPAIAPHLAAQETGVAIRLEVIINAFNELSSLADVVIVEGVGGWQVPLNVDTDNAFTVAKLAEQLLLPVVLVVAMRLGCLNHALLSHYSIYSSQCKMAGWIANSIENDFLFSQEQIELLQGQIKSPLLAHIAWQEDAVESDDNFNNERIIDLDHLQLQS